MEEPRRSRRPTFNAAWEAGLDITERNPHALYISRYPLGRDATVYWPTLDLKFRNDTKHWILVKGYAEPDGIRVSIYGGEARRVVSSPGTMEVTGAIPVKRVKDPTLAKGTTVVQSEGQPPSQTSVTRTVYDASGNVVHHETWNTSYKAEDKVVRVGTKAPTSPRSRRKSHRRRARRRPAARPRLRRRAELRRRLGRSDRFDEPRRHACRAVRLAVDRRVAREALSHEVVAADDRVLVAEARTAHVVATRPDR